MDLLWRDHGLVAELDSGHHDVPRARAADAGRDADLRAAGFAVVRFRRREMRADGDALENRLRRILAT